MSAILPASCTAPVPPPLAALTGTPVRVYRNILRRCWSVQYRQPYLRADGRVGEGWRVAGHDTAVVLGNVVFDVNQYGRQRVLKTGHKNVHAYATGILLSTEQYADLDRGLFKRAAKLCNLWVGYNPRKEAQFCIRAEWPGEAAERVVLRARTVLLDGEGLVWIDRKDG